MKLCVVCFSIICGLLCVACNQGGRAVSVRTAPIIGGEPVPPGRYRNTVALTDADGALFCSGTAITRHLVLSAAHCLSKRQPPYEDKIRIYLGEGDSSKKVPLASLFKIKKASYNPKYRDSVAGANDMAYLVTAEPLPLENEDFITPLTDYDEIVEAIVLNHDVRLVGFGAQKRTLSFDGGTKHQVDTKINFVQRALVRIGDDKRGAYFGDSGGPAFVQLMNGQWRYFGITSGGGMSGGPGSFGLLHDNLCWLAKDSGVDIDGASQHCYEDAKPIDPDASVIQSFREQCANKDVFRRRTVTVLKRQLNVGDDCGLIERELLSRGELNLDNSFLVDLSPIAALSDLKQISLIGNEHASLLPMKRLKGLRAVQVDLSHLYDRNELIVLQNSIPDLKIKIVNPKAEMFLAVGNDDMLAFSLALDNLESLEVEDEEGNNPLHQCAFKGRLEMARKLISKGVNINAVSRQYHHSALILAVYHSDLAMVRLLVEAGIDVSIMNKWGHTALDEARYYGAKEIVKYLEGLKIE